MNKDSHLIFEAYLAAEEKIDRVHTGDGARRIKKIRGVLTWLGYHQPRETGPADAPGLIPINSPWVNPNMPGITITAKTGVGTENPPIEVTAVNSDTDEFAIMQLPMDDSPLDKGQWMKFIAFANPAVLLRA